VRRVESRDRYRQLIWQGGLIYWLIIRPLGTSSTLPLLTQRAIGNKYQLYMSDDHCGRWIFEKALHKVLWRCIQVDDITFFLLESTTSLLIIVPCKMWYGDHANRWQIYSSWDYFLATIIQPLTMPVLRHQANMDAA
jgi:hypothetical protein